MEVKIMTELCRICLGSDLLQPIFRSIETDLSQKIMACASVHVARGDPLPTKVCHRCYNALEIAYDFKIRCETMDKQLRKIIEDQTEMLNQGKKNKTEVNSSVLSIKSKFNSDCSAGNNINISNNMEHIILPSFVKNTCIDMIEDNSNHVSHEKENKENQFILANKKSCEIINNTFDNQLSNAENEQNQFSLNETLVPQLCSAKIYKDIQSKISDEINNSISVVATMNVKSGKVILNPHLNAVKKLNADVNYDNCWTNETNSSGLLTDSQTDLQTESYQNTDSIEPVLIWNKPNLECVSSEKLGTSKEELNLDNILPNTDIKMEMQTGSNATNENKSWKSAETNVLKDNLKPKGRYIVIKSVIKPDNINYMDLSIVTKEKLFVYEKENEINSNSTTYLQSEIPCSSAFEHSEESNDSKISNNNSYLYVPEPASYVETETCTSNSFAYEQTFSDLKNTFIETRVKTTACTRQKIKVRTKKLDKHRPPEGVSYLRSGRPNTKIPIVRPKRKKYSRTGNFYNAKRIQAILLGKDQVYSYSTPIIKRARVEKILIPNLNESTQIKCKQTKAKQVIAKRQLASMNGKIKNNHIFDEKRIYIDRKQNIHRNTNTKIEKCIDPLNPDCTDIVDNRTIHNLKSNGNAIETVGRHIAKKNAGHYKRITQITKENHKKSKIDNKSVTKTTISDDLEIIKSAGKIKSKVEEMYSNKPCHDENSFYITTLQAIDQDIVNMNKEHETKIIQSNSSIENEAQLESCENPTEINLLHNSKNTSCLSSTSSECKISEEDNKLSDEKNMILSTVTEDILQPNNLEINSELEAEDKITKNTNKITDDKSEQIPAKTGRHTALKSKQPKKRKRPNSESCTNTQKYEIEFQLLPRKSERQRSPKKIFPEFDFFSSPKRKHADKLTDGIKIKNDGTNDNVERKKDLKVVIRRENSNFKETVDDSDSSYVDVKEEHGDDSSDEAYLDSENGSDFVTNSSTVKLKTEHRSTQKDPVVLNYGSDLSCDVCNKSFPYRSHLIRHVRTHTGLRPYCCRFCKKAYTSLSSLSNHMKNHTGDYPYSCKVCNKGFSQPSVLRRHMNSHTGQRPYSCEICLKTFSHDCSLKTHLKMHAIKEPQHRCEICDKRFKYASTLTSHIKTHSGIKPFTCHECRKAFYRASLLNRHMRSHTKERPYKCKICKERFAYSGGLSSHMKLHTGIRPFKCTMCEYTFFRMSHLKNHMSKIHNDGDLMECQHCYIKFDSKPLYKQHLNLHVKLETDTSFNDAEM